MIFRRTLSIMTVAVGLGAGPGTWAVAQDTAVPKDDALDSLLEKLSEPSDRADKKLEKPAATKKEAQEAKNIGRSREGKAARRRDGQARRPARREDRREGCIEIRRLDVADGEGPGGR